MISSYGARRLRRTHRSSIARGAARRDRTKDTITRAWEDEPLRRANCRNRQTLRDIAWWRAGIAAAYFSTRPRGGGNRRMRLYDLIGRLTASISLLNSPSSDSQNPRHEKDAHDQCVNHVPVVANIADVDICSEQPDCIAAGLVKAPPIRETQVTRNRRKEVRVMASRNPNPVRSRAVTKEFSRSRKTEPNSSRTRSAGPCRRRRRGRT